MQDGHSTKTRGRAPRHSCAWLGQGWGLGQQLPVDTSPGWGLVLCLPALSLAHHITNIFSLRGLHLPPSRGSSTAWVWSLIKLAEKSPISDDDVMLRPLVFSLKYTCVYLFSAVTNVIPQPT